MSDNSGRSGGVSILGLLGVCFVVLKLCGVISWSWWLVTLPFWGGLALLFGWLGFLLFLAVIGWMAIEVKDSFK